MSSLEFGTPQRARARNRRLVLDVVWHEGTVTRAELGSIIKLSKSAIKEICEGLIEDGLLEEVQLDSAARKQGRPALSLRVAGLHGNLLGIDIGADKVVARSATLAGETIASREIRTRQDDPDHRDVLALVDRAVSAVHAAGGFHTVVVSTPGIVDPTTQRVRLAPQIRGWDGIDVRAAVAERVGVDLERVFVERQTDLSMLAESIDGAARGARSVFYVQIGIGIGAGLLLDGRVYRGAEGAAGEVGYLAHDFGEVAPPDSGIGAWEWAAGGQAWARHGRAAALEPRGARLRELAGGDPDRVDAEIVVNAAREGDPAARAVFDRLTDRLAVGIASAVCVLNPDCVVVAGGLSQAGPILRDALAERLRPLVPVVPDVRLAAYGGDGGVTGAVHRASKYAFDALTPLP
ncbi:MAG: ROK family protein [Microbacterium sp.]|uniref:ROK family protein n=1 Tax=Microbacterium sp. TaxID=51671 RepID=UPI0025D58636|nr:ROK family protein [Microbacterium sp.]MBQ9918509.1 ROK family protein [Microbacterium sp.]